MFNNPFLNWIGLNRCIPYRLKEEKQEDDGDKPCSSSCMEEMMEVLLISSQKGGDEIMFPKVHKPQTFGALRKQKKKNKS